MISEPENYIPFTVVYIDLDDFKRINDTYGHLEGDCLLRDVGKALGTSLREEDVLARIGGDEFSLLLPNTDFQSTKNLLETSRQCLAKINIQGSRITCSFGAMVFTHPPTTSSKAMCLADDLMYAAKKKGKNAIYINVYDGRTNDQDSLEYKVHYGRRCDDVV